MQNSGRQRPNLRAPEPESVLGTGARRDLAGTSNLTHSQMVIWLGQKLLPDIPLYNMAFLFRVDGAIDAEIFKCAFAQLVAESDSLRTTFKEERSVPQQRVSNHMRFQLKLLDMSQQSETEIKQWAAEKTAQPFDLTSRLFESVIIRRSLDCFFWYLNIHHLITDAASSSVLYRRLEMHYRRLRDHAALPERPVTFQEYVEFERSQRAAKSNRSAAEYWAEKSQQVFAPIAFYGRETSNRTARSQRRTGHLGTDRTQALRKLARELDPESFSLELSLFKLFATLLFAYLFRVSGNRELCIGAPSHNRQFPKFKETSGLFIETLPLSVSIDEGETYESLFRKVSLETHRFLLNLRPGCSRPDRSRSFEVLLNFVTASFSDFAGVPAQAEWIHSGYADPTHSLRLQVHDFDLTGDLSLSFDLNVDAIIDTQRHAVAKHFINMTDCLLADKNQPIEQSSIVTSDEVYSLRATSDPSTATNRVTVTSMIEDQAERNPDVVAVEQGGDRLTYADLNQRANKVARLLQGRGVGTASKVAVVTRRSTESVIAILGVLKAGAAYVPIDASSPSMRIEFMLRDASCDVALTGSTVSHAALTQCPSINLDDADLFAEVSGSNLSTAPSLDDSAYVIYTSGSTGIPKGVVVGHRALSNYVQWAQQNYVGNQQLAFPLFTPLSFDLTVTSIFVPLITGGRIVIYPDAGAQADLALLDVLDDNRVDIIKLTPSHLLLMQDRDLSGSRVSQLILGGEDLRSDVARRILQKFDGRVQIHNEYGPTEATVGCIIHTFDVKKDQTASVPIGQPIDNMEAFVLNHHLSPVPQGVIGDLYVAGEGLATGYLNRTELTRERFLEHPLVPGTLMYKTGDVARVNGSGQLECLGRDDFQVKIRGARIELGEIEAALAEHGDVTACVAHAFARLHPETDTIQHCVQCGLASNFPDVRFNEQGICNTCSSFASYKHKAEQYFKSMDDLRRLFDESKPTNHSGYDCLALLSGGKDSTYALCQLVDMGLKVLAFTLDNGYISEQAKDNIRRVATTLGVEHIFGTTPAMNEIFVDSLKRHANVCNGCFKTIYTLSTKIAKEKGIPFIVTGLSRGQFFETRLTEELFTSERFQDADIDQIVLAARKAYHRMDDAVSQKLDTEMFRDDSLFDEVQFVDFYRYNDVGLDDMLAYLHDRVPWIRPSDTGRSTNCLINDVGIYVHRRQRGFHNYALPYSWDVRMGHKSRGEALAELDDDINVQDVQRILREVGYDDDDVSGAEKRLVAYYLAPADIPTSDLRNHLQSRLPGYMIPSQIVRIDEIPLSSNGKVDRSKLPQPDMRPASSESYVAPRTDTEQKLAKIWQEVLQTDRIGIRDNFFDLGGDSITAIQIVARANRLDLPIIPMQLFNALTIEKLAAVCGRAPVADAQQGLLSGPLELTPVQRWLLDQEHDHPAHWNQVVRLQLSDEVDGPTLEKSLSALTRHHDVLRSRFAKTDGRWTAVVTADPVPVELTVSNLNAETEKENAQRVIETENYLNENLDISQGRLCAAALFNSNNRPPKLTLVIHQLIVDGLSWPIVLEDLATAYKQTLAGQPVDLPNKTTSFKKWSSLLRGYHQSKNIQQETTYWRHSLDSPVAELPVDFSGIDVVREDSTDTLTISLSQTQTSQLLNDVSRVYRITVHEVLVSAFAMTLAQWTRNRCVRFNLEGHGREPIFSGVDVSRTVGWFTSIYPVTVSLPEDDGLSSLLSSVKDQLRRIPHHGIGYGILRHLSPDPEVRKALSRGIPQVVFNYLGRGDLISPENSLIQHGGPIALSRDPKSVRPHLIEVSALLSANSLRIDFSFSRSVHSEATIRHLAEDFRSKLAVIIDHCLASGASEASPSDFPLAKLSKDKLEKLSKLLKNPGDSS